MNLYDITVKTRDDKEIKLNSYKGKILLIVNTATGCGFTPQYEGLEKLYQKYHDKGLEILDFPCNQFGNQAPGTDEEIHQFCTLKYNTSFEQFKKVDVNGENEAPIFAYIKKEFPYKEVKGLKNSITMKTLTKLSNTSNSKTDIRWNFTKFLVDRVGNVINRFEPITKPEEIEEEIKKLI